MIRAMLHGMLGDYGDAIVNFMVEHPVAIAVFLGLWMGLILAAKLQLRRIKRETVRFVVREGTLALARNPNLTAAQLFDLLFPRWSVEVSRWAWFIPHRWELWPVPARLAAIEQKFQFSPAWLEQLLQQQGILKRGAGDDHGSPA